MDFTAAIKAPTSFRLTQLAQNAYEMPLRAFENTHETHPSLPHLCLLVFEAVLEVVCVSLPGYIIARLGHFDAEKQKFLANLNVMLFTPCLSTFEMDCAFVSTGPRFADLQNNSLHQASLAAQR